MDKRFVLRKPYHHTVLAVSLSRVMRCNNCCNCISLLLTLYLTLKDNMGIDVENLCFSKNIKELKTLQMEDYVIFKLCFKLGELEVVV